MVLHIVVLLKYVLICSPRFSHCKISLFFLSCTDWVFSRISEKDCNDGGYQQEENTGSSGYGAVTQVPLTAFYGADTVDTVFAALDDDTCKI